MINKRSKEKLISDSPFVVAVVGAPVVVLAVASVHSTVLFVADLIKSQ